MSSGSKRPKGDTVSAMGSKNATRKARLATQQLNAAEVIKAIRPRTPTKNSSDEDDSPNNIKTEGCRRGSRRSANRNQRHHDKRDLRSYNKAMENWKARTDEEKSSGQYPKPR